MKLIKVSPKVIEWTGIIGATAAATVVRALFSEHLPKPTSKLKTAWFYVGTYAIGVTIMRAVRKALMEDAEETIVDVNQIILDLDVNAE